MGMYVDNCLNARDLEFEKLNELTLSIFDSKPRVYDSFDFFGTQLVTLKSRYFHVSQKYYATTINFVEKGSSFGECRRRRALFSWLCHICPDIACYAQKATQVTEKKFSSEKILELKKGIQMINSSVRLGLTFKPIDLKSTHIRV